MTYTTQQLQAMSDFEVNKALCIKLGYDVSGISEQRNMMTDAVADYCKNPSDIMPLAFECRISINFCPHLDAWTASAWKKTGKMESTMVNSFRCDTNPLRAIACLILMMED